MLGRIHQMVKMSGPVWTNVYWVLFVAVDSLTQSPIHLNQLLSHLLMLVGSQSQVIQWLDLLWTFLLLPLPEGIAHEDLAHPNTLPHDLWWQPMAMNAFRLLWPAKGANDTKGKGSCYTPKHKKAQRWDTGTSSVLIPPEMTEWLNKTEGKQIKFLLGNKKLALYCW
jgi:hypothetical protein